MSQHSDSALVDDSHARRYSVLPAAQRHTPVVHEIEIKRSRFIGYLFRVEAEEDVREHVSALRKEHHLARHACSAFLLGPDRRVMRSNDDGEPAGTAGTPMLEAIAQRETVLVSAEGTGAEQLRDASDVLAVVVRYFGGVKLGAGGLVRAYSDAVSQTLDQVTWTVRQRMLWYRIPAPHAVAGRWENELRATGWHLGVTDYAGSSALLTLASVDDDMAAERLKADLAAISSGAGQVEPTHVEWTDL
ncbi:IMPACT family protein [Citricoccus muralis]|uniref:IMPACT family protein n=1 Tax=Citricoccus muralis TaxID=169134 RepID=A0ABY8H2C5_9MICC|nr:YigZ family protein [Citricoccus muralis]WFP15279.1 IMPACT family protein [Citricoccus muralis]